MKYYSFNKEYSNMDGVWDHYSYVKQARQEEINAHILTIQPGRCGTE